MWATALTELKLGSKLQAAQVETYTDIMPQRSSKTQHDRPPNKLMPGTLQRKLPVSDFPDTCHTLRIFRYQFIRLNNIRNLFTSDILLTKTTQDCIKKSCHTSANRETFAYYSKTESHIPPYYIHPCYRKLLDVDRKNKGITYTQ